MTDTNPAPQSQPAPASPSAQSQLRRMALVVLLLLPPLALGTLLWYRSSRRAVQPTAPATPSARPSASTGSVEHGVPIDEWPDGKPKILMREWGDHKDSFQELCFLAQDGASLGCGVLKNEEPWNGTLVEWKKLKPFKLKLYKDGQPHGVWQVFEPDGSSSEFNYEEGRLVWQKGASSAAPPAKAPPEDIEE